MKWVVRRLFKQPPHDLELVAQGIDHAFSLFLLNTLLLLATMIAEAVFNIALWKWAFPAIIVLGFVGIVLIGYQIGSKAVHVAWLLGTIPFAVLLLILVIYGTLSNDPPPKGIWIVCALTIMASLGGSVAGDFQHRMRRKKIATGPE